MIYQFSSVFSSSTYSGQSVFLNVDTYRNQIEKQKKINKNQTWRDKILRKSLLWNYQKNDSSIQISAHAKTVNIVRYITTFIKKKRLHACFRFETTSRITHVLLDARSGDARTRHFSATLNLFIPETKDENYIT